MVSTEVVTGGTQRKMALSRGSFIHLAPWQGQMEDWAQLILSPGAFTWGLSRMAVSEHLDILALRASVPLKPPSYKLQEFLEQTLGVPESHFCFIPLAKQVSKTKPGFVGRRFKYHFLGEGAKDLWPYLIHRPYWHPFHYFMLGLNPHGSVSLFCRLHNAIPHQHPVRPYPLCTTEI